MVVHKPRGKKLVYVPEELIEGIAEVSRVKGASVTKYVEDILRQAVRVDRLGFSSTELADMLEVIQVQRVLGGTFVPLAVVNFISSDEERQPSRDQVRSIWYESGILYGTYIKERFPNPIPTFQTLLRVMRWDLNEVGIREEGGELKMRCVSTSLNGEGTEVLSRFVEGAMNGMGYRTVRRECMRGMIIIDFSPIP